MTGPNGEPLVRLSGVNKWFGALHVLQDVDLEIAPRRGRGRDRPVRVREVDALPHDQPPRADRPGEITIDGQQLPEEGKELARLRSDVGMVFQSFNLFAH